MNIPLVSQYKIPFILQRISATFFGGFELSPLACSEQLCLKIAIYLFPCLLGVLGTVLIDCHLVDHYIGVLTVSIVNFLAVLSMHLIACIQRESAKSRLLTGDKPKTGLQQLIPLGGHHTTLAGLVFSTLAASLIGLMAHIFQPSQLAARFDRNIFIASAIFVTAWFSFVVAHHSLVMGPPPETAAYSMAFNKADSFNRPVHLLAALGLLAVIPDHMCPHQPLTLLVCLLPILWLLGVVPPIQSSVHHCIETINILLLGGTGSYSVASLATTVLLCGCTVLLGHFFLSAHHFLLVCSVFAFLASNKWLRNWDRVGGLFHFGKTFFHLLVIVAIAYLPEHSASDSALVLVVVFLVTVISVLKHSQRIYLLNWVKNPLDVFLPRNLLTAIQSNSIAIKAVRFFLHCVLPFVSLAIVHSRIDREFLTDRLGQAEFDSVLLDILVFRLFRQIWQYPFTLACQLVAIPLLDIWLADHAAVNWPIEVKHFILSFALGLGVDFTHKLYLMLVILWASVFLKKQRLGFSWMLFMFNIFIFPVNLAIILVSCLLRAPILPLFTLPIYLLSFPRPLQFWSTTPSTTKQNTTDASYYQQILPRLVEALREQRLFWDFCRAGEFLLARYEDRLMWIQVLESGHNYVTIQMKGLELQETSCHAIEASAIDHIIELAFSEERRSRCLNSHFLYTIAPVTRVSVKTYSDARNILTGIIDSPATYSHIKVLFCQVLIWLLMERRIAAIKAEHSLTSSKFASAQKSIHPVKSKKKKKNAVGDIESQDRQAVHSLTYELLQPKMEWSNASYQYSKLRGGHQMLSGQPSGCSVEWFQEALRVHSEDHCHLNSNELQSLNLTYCNIANVCFSLLFQPAYTEVPTSQSICQIFNGEVATDLDKKFFESNADLFAVCIKSFQYCTKISFDQIIFSNDSLTFTELATLLQDFDLNWHFGNRTLPDWKEAVLAEKGNLFSIGKDMVKENYTSHLLTLQNMDVYVCSLNRATIEAIWSSLSLELFYLTNDDEERYSIQAHQIILRNLTVQAADPPLGYPVLLSEPTIINHLTYG